IDPFPHYTLGGYWCFETAKCNDRTNNKKSYCSNGCRPTDRTLGHELAKYASETAFRTACNFLALSKRSNLPVHKKIQLRRARLDLKIQQPLRNLPKLCCHGLAFAAMFQMASQRRCLMRFEFAIEIRHDFFGLKRV